MLSMGPAISSPVFRDLLHHLVECRARAHAADIFLGLECLRWARALCRRLHVRVAGPGFVNVQIQISIAIRSEAT